MARRRKEMIVKTEKLGNEIVLTFRTPIEYSADESKIKAAEIFEIDLNEYLQKKNPKEKPYFNVNFINDLNIEQVFVLKKGKIIRHHQVTLILIKEPA